MPVLNNPRHEHFACSYVICGNASEAWRRRAGGTGSNADVHGPSWMVKSGISERIAELRQEADDASDLSRGNLTAWLARIINGKEKVQPEQLRAAEILSKMCGWITAEKVESAVTVRVTRAWVE